MSVRNDTIKLRLHAYEIAPRYNSFTILWEVSWRHALKDTDRKAKSSHRVEVIEENLKGMATGILPKNIRQFNPPFESPMIDNDFDEQDKEFTVVIPAKTSFRDTMRLLHLHFHTSIAEVELVHQKLLKSNAEEKSSLRTLVDKVNQFELPEERGTEGNGR